MNSNFQIYWRNSFRCILPMVAIFIISLSLLSFTLFIVRSDVLENPAYISFQTFSVKVSKAAVGRTLAFKIWDFYYGHSREIFH